MTMMDRSPKIVAASKPARSCKMLMAPMQRGHKRFIGVYFPSVVCVWCVSMMSMSSKYKSKSLI